MATNTVNRSVNIFIETGDAQKSLDKLIAKEKDLKDQLAKATDPTQIKKLQTEIDKLQEPISRAGKKISGELSPSLRDMGLSISKLANEIKNLSKEDPTYNKKLLQLKSATLEYNKQKAAISGLKQEHEDSSNSFLGMAKRIAEGVGLYKVAELAIEKTVEFAKGIIDETLEAEAANSKLKNILDNLGRVDVFETLKKEAEDLTDTFKAVKGEEIVNSFAQLATYGKISENQIKALEPVIIDFARKSGISIEESTSTIIKALEGNGKALKEYGINIKDGQSVTERFGIIMQQLKPRVEGAQLAFEKTGAGFGARLKESIANIQEGLGNLIQRLIASKKSADEQFDEAKVKTEGYERSLQPLISRYDELKGKTTLNKNEQEELKGIIQKIAEIIPDSVTQFNKYGVALDINRGKVEEFSKAQKQFLAEKEFEAVKQLTADALENARQISNAAKNLNEGGSRSVKGEFVAFGEGDRESVLASLRNRQEELIKQADALTNKYGKQLPDSVKKAVDAIKAEFDAINKVKTPGADSPLNPNADDPNKKEKKSPENQFAEDLQKLAEQQSKIAVLNKSEFEKKLAEAQRQYDTFQALFATQLKKQELTQAQHDEALKQAHENLIEEQHQLRIAEINRALDEQVKADKKLADDRLRAFADYQARLAQSLAARADQLMGQRTATAELEVLKATGEKKLEALKAQLNLEEEIALAAADAIGKKRELIEEQYRQKRKKLEEDYLTSTIQQYGAYLNELASSLQNFFSIQNQAAQADIDRETTVNNRKKALYQKQLDSKLITQKEYQRKVDALDKDLNNKQNALKLKQFNQEKILGIAHATANVAEAVTKMLTAGPVIGQILAGIAAGIGLVQIGIIAKQKPPEFFASGGFIPQGPSHAERGIKLVDGRTGQVRGEIEGGEPILSRATYRNNRSLVDALLNSSMHNGGAALQPAWKNAPVSHMNYSGIQQSLSRFRVYAGGGILPEDSPAGLQADQNAQVLLALATEVSRLNGNLETGIRAHVPLTELNEQQQRLQSIKDDATGR